MTKRPKISIRPEYTAQRRSHPPNPALRQALEFVRRLRGGGRNWGRVGDLGCGKLRHYNFLVPRSNELYLIDTPEQLCKIHYDAGEEYTVREIADSARKRGRAVFAFSFIDFASGKLELDLVVCIAVLDVVLPRIRTALIRAAAQNLSRSGLCVIIVPRNDSTILERCGRGNAYGDGHIFSHHGVHTFFHNFRNHRRIVDTCKKAGLQLLKDLSCYRQVCLIFGGGGRSGST